MLKLEFEDGAPKCRPTFTARIQFLVLRYRAGEDITLGSTMKDLRAPAVLYGCCAAMALVE